MANSCFAPLSLVPAPTLGRDPDIGSGPRAKLWNGRTWTIRSPDTM
jgi:hypothetical protein